MSLTSSSSLSHLFLYAPSTIHFQLCSRPFGGCDWFSMMTLHSPKIMGCQSLILTPYLCSLLRIFVDTSQAWPWGVAHSHSHSFWYLKLLLKVRVHFSNRGDVTLRDVSGHILPCEPWSKESVSAESREWGRYAETNVSCDTHRETARPRCKFSIPSSCSVARTSQYWLD